MSASSSAVGSSCTEVSAMNTVRAAGHDDGMAEHARRSLGGRSPASRPHRWRGSGGSCRSPWHRHRPIHHAGGEHVAVLVDHALAVAAQVAVALQRGVEQVGVLLVVLATAARCGSPGPRRRRAQASASSRRSAPRGRSGSACRSRLAERRRRRGSRAPPRPRRRRRAWDGRAPGRRCAAASRPWDRAAPRARGDSRHVDDRLARHAGLHRRLRHRSGNGRDQARIERHRHDVFRPIAQPAAGIGGVDLVGHVLARQWPPAPRRRRSSSRR